jgi:sortase A
VLTYEVDQIKVVLPSETKDLYVVEGQDYVTLLTCTPYTINTHRLLVRGKRVIEEKPDEIVIHNISTDSGNIYFLGYKINYVYAAIGIGGFIAAVLMVVFLITRINKRKKSAHLKKDGDGDG